MRVRTFQKSETMNSIQKYYFSLTGQLNQYKYWNWLVKTTTETSLTDTGKVYSIIIKEREFNYY